MALRYLDLKAEIEKIAEKLRRWQLALDRASAAMEKISPETREFYAVSMDDNDSYVGMCCKSCEGMHDTVASMEEFLARAGRLRHKLPCPVAKLEEMLAKARGTP